MEKIHLEKLQEIVAEETRKFVQENKDKLTARIRARLEKLPNES